jgi:hypothetical protein
MGAESLVPPIRPSANSRWAELGVDAQEASTRVPNLGGGLDEIDGLLPGLPLCVEGLFEDGPSEGAARQGRHGLDDRSDGEGHGQSFSSWERERQSPPILEPAALCESRCEALPTPRPVKRGAVSRPFVESGAPAQTLRPPDE